MKSVLRSAPIAGLDLASPMTAVKEGNALRLDDWVCRPDGLHVRNGHEVQTRHAGAVTALLSYPGHLISATASTVFDGNVAVAIGMSGGDWSGSVIANPGGSHLIMVNGADTPRHFNGQLWQVANITEVDSTSLSQIITHQRRLFAVEKNSLRIWYLGLDAIGGPASPIYLEAQCQRGGYLVAIASMNATGGRGKEQQLVAVTSKGELIVYKGTNPDDKDSWSLAGVWDVPVPEGPRCFAKIGGSLALLTVAGLLSVPGELALADDEKKIKALTHNIAPAVGSTGVEVIESGSAELALIQTVSGAQFVKSSTGGWTRWTGTGGSTGAATCWLEHEGALYFGTSDGRVCKYAGDLDGNAPIRTYAVDSFSKFGSPAKKRFTRIRPLYRAAHPYMPRMELLTDYRTPPDTFTAANIDDRYWQWSDVTWPRQPMPWMRETSAQLQPWRSVSGRGHCAATMLSMQTRTQVIWTGTEITFDAGGRL